MKASINLTDNEIIKLGLNPDDYLRHIFINDKKVVKFSEKELSNAMYSLPKIEENNQLRYYLQSCGHMRFNWDMVWW